MADPQPPERDDWEEVELPDDWEEVPAEAASSNPQVPAGFEGEIGLGGKSPLSAGPLRPFDKVPQLRPEMFPDNAEMGRRMRTILEMGGPAAAMVLAPELGVFPAMALAGGSSAAASGLSEFFDPTPADRPAPIANFFGADWKGPGGRAKEAAGLGIAAEGAGRLALAPVLNWLSRGVMRSRAPDAVAREAAAQAVAQGGGVLPPAQATGRPVARWLQGLAESSAFGGRVGAARQQAAEIAQGNLRQFADQYPLLHSREELGRVLQEAVRGNESQAMQHAGGLYRAADQARQAVAGPGAALPVRMNPARWEAAALEREASAGLPNGRSGTILDAVQNKPATMSFEGAAKLRSDLLRVVRGEDDLVTGQAPATAKRLAGIVDQFMEESARVAGPQVETAWRTANDNYGNLAELYNSPIVHELMNREPEAVLDAILRSNRPGSIRKAEEAVGNPQLWKGVQREYLERLLTKDAVDPATRLPQGQNILTKLRQFGDSGRELLGPRASGDLEELADILRVTQEFTGKGAGGVNVRGLPEFATTAAMFLHPSPLTLGLGLTPAAVGQAFSRPGPVRALTQGFNLSKDVAPSIEGLLQALAHYGAADDPAQKR